MYLFGLSSHSHSTTFPQNRGPHHWHCPVLLLLLPASHYPKTLNWALLLPLSHRGSHLLLLLLPLKESPCSASHLSPLASHIDAHPQPQQSRYFSLTLFAPSLCLPRSISICFFVSCFCQFLRDFFWFFSLGELLI